MDDDLGSKEQCWVTFVASSWHGIDILKYIHHWDTHINTQQSCDTRNVVSNLFPATVSYNHYDLVFTVVASMVLCSLTSRYCCSLIHEMKIVAIF